MTRLTTPRGTPARASTSTTYAAVSGVSRAGLRIVVQPAASAGASLRVAIAAGKFHGRDQQRDADRLPGDDDPLVAGGREPVVAGDAHGLLGEPAEELGGVGGLADRVRPRLAVLADHDLGEALGLGGEDLPRATEDLAALARGGRRPGGQRLGGGRDGVVAVLLGRDGEVGDRRAVGGVEDGEPAAVGAGPPGAVDVQVGAEVEVGRRRRCRCGRGHDAVLVMGVGSGEKASGWRARCRRVRRMWPEQHALGLVGVALADRRDEHVVLVVQDPVAVGVEQSG